MGPIAHFSISLETQLLARPRWAPVVGGYTATEPAAVVVLR